MVDQNNTNNLKPVKAEGQSVYGFGSYEQTSYRIDSEFVYKLMTNPYICGALNTLRSTTFIGVPTVKVKNADGEIDEDLSSEYKYNVLDINKVDYKAVQAWEDNVWGGCSLFSPTIEKKNGKLIITEIRHLPYWSFSQSPPGINKKYNPVMPGVVYNEKTGQVEAYQCLYLTYGSTNQIHNFFVIKDPAAADPAGESEVVPIIPIIVSINLADKAENMRVNRVGSPNVFVRVNEDFINDTMQQYLNAFVSKWGISTGFLIPNNCELIDPHLIESGAAIERLEYLKKMISYFFYPTDAVQKNGTLIGGSDAGATQVLLNSISYKLSYIEAAFEDLYNKNLAANGYDGYTISIKFPRPNIDKSELLIKELEIAVKAGAVDENDVRRNLPDLDLKELDEEGIAKMREKYAKSMSQSFSNLTEIGNAAAPSFGNREVNKRVAETEKQLTNLVDEYEKDVMRIVEEDPNWIEYKKMYKELQEENE